MPSIWRPDIGATIKLYLLMLSDNLKLKLEFITKAFGFAVEEPFILEILRSTPEKDKRFAISDVRDEDLQIYLNLFEELNEFEWCRVIQEVMNERLKS
jgi:hypothetical protein